MKRLLHSICMTALLGLVATWPHAVRAQHVAQGTFVLPFEVQWQGKTLPAGEYHFTLRRNVRYVLLLRDAQNLRNIMIVEAQVKDDFKGQNALAVVNRDGKRYVYSLAFEPIGATLVYAVPTRKRAADRKLEALVQIIPVQRVGS